MLYIHRSSNGISCQSRRICSNSLLYQTTSLFFYRCHRIYSRMYHRLVTSEQKFTECKTLTSRITCLEYNSTWRWSTCADNAINWRTTGRHAVRIMRVTCSEIRKAAKATKTHLDYRHSSVSAAYHSSDGHLVACAWASEESAEDAEPVELW